MTAEDIDFRINLSADTSGAEAAVGGLEEAGDAAERAKKKVAELDSHGVEVKGEVVLDDTEAKKKIADLEGKKVKVKAKVETEAAKAAPSPSAQAAPKAAPAATVEAPTVEAPEPVAVEVKGAVKIDDAEAKDKVTELAAKPVEVKGAVKLDGEAAKGVVAGIEAEAAEVGGKITLDDAAAKDKVSGIAAEQVEVRGSVDLDTAAAKEAVADLEGEKVKVGGDVKLDDNDAKEAIAGIEAKAAEVDGKVVLDDDEAKKKAADLEAKPVEVKGKVVVDDAEVDKAKNAARGAAGAAASGAEKEGDAAEKADKAGLEKAKADLLAALKALDDKASAYGGEAADRMRKQIATIREAVTKEGDEKYAEAFGKVTEAIKGIVAEGNKLPPKGVEALGEEIVDLNNKFNEFRAEVEKTEDVKINVSVTGIEGIKLLEDKLEVIKNAKGLATGINELEAAVTRLDPKKADPLLKMIASAREMLTKPMNSSNIDEIEKKLADISKHLSGLDLGDTGVGEAAEKLLNAQGALAKLRDSAHGIGAELRDEFDAANFVTSVFSGNVEGVTKGLIGIASGAKVAGAALRTMIASTIVGAIVMAVAAVATALKKWVTYIRDARGEADKLRLEKAKTAIAESNALLEHRMQILNLERQKVDAVTERYQKQIDVVKALADANDDLAMSRELANAKTEREREEITAKYAARKGSRSAGVDLEKAVASERQYKDNLAITKKELDARKYDAGQTKTGLDKQAEYIERVIRRASRYGYGVELNEKSGTANVWGMREMIAQWAHDNGLGSARDRFGNEIKAQDFKIPKETMDAWERFVDIWDGVGGVHIKPSDLPTSMLRSSDNLAGMNEDETVKHLQSEYSSYRGSANKYEIDKAKLDKDLKDYEYSSGRGREAKEAETRAASMAEMKKLLADAEKIEAARTAFTSGQTIVQREFERSREDAYAYDNGRAALTERRMQEHRGYANAYMNGGVDEYGRRIEGGINGIKDDEARFRKMVEDTAEMRLAAAKRNASGEGGLTEKEKALAKQWDDTKTAFSELQARVQDNAARLPGLIEGYSKQQTAMNQLVAAMDQLAVSYRDEARSARMEEANRRRNREEADRTRTYGQQGRGTKLALDTEMQEKSGHSVAALEMDMERDRANRDRYADLRRRENGGETLTGDDKAFVDAFADKDKQDKVERADELEYRDLVQEDLNEEEKKELEALKAETAEYRIVAQRVVEARKRQLEFEEQRKEAAREAAEQAKREIEKDNEERTHTISREDRLAAWDRAYGKQGSYGKLGMATELEKRGTERFNTADRILRYEDRGMRDEEGNRLPADEIVKAIESLGVKMTDKEKEGIGANRMDENLRARIERARNEGREDQRRGRQERWQAEDAARESEVKFRLGQVKQGNRLTQMGLGGDVTGGWQRETANNTKEMCKLGGKIITTLKGMQDTRRMFGTNGSTWAMR